MLEQMAHAQMGAGAFLDACRTLEQACGAFVEQDVELSPVRATTLNPLIGLFCGVRPSPHGCEPRG